MRTLHWLGQPLVNLTFPAILNKLANSSVRLVIHRVSMLTIEKQTSIAIKNGKCFVSLSCYRMRVGDKHFLDHNLISLSRL